VSTRLITLWLIVAVGVSACSLTLSEPAASITPTALPTLTETSVPTQTVTPTSEDIGDSTNASNNASVSDESGCTVRDDWFTYTIQSGDTLGRIATLARTTVDDLVAANCLENPNQIFAGQVIRVPVRNLVSGTTGTGGQLASSSQSGSTLSTSLNGSESGGAVGNGQGNNGTATPLPFGADENAPEFGFGETIIGHVDFELPDTIPGPSLGDYIGADTMNLQQFNSIQVTPVLVPFENEHVILPVQP